MKEDHGKLDIRLGHLSEHVFDLNGLVQKIAGHLFGIRDIVLDDIGENGT
ncbi:MAG: hypothetical protein OXE92_01870 [Bacteroidetes bacterium]|nr:hypothetical protein [Bacteroidota bacterium]